MALINFPLLIPVAEDEDARLELNIRRRQLRDASNPLEIPDHNFRSIYRMDRQTAHDLIVEIAPFLTDPLRESGAIPKQLKILVALHFLAQGSYQKGCGQDANFPMCQASVSNCLTAVTDAIDLNLRHLIAFPITPESKNEEKRKFMQHPFGFPGIIGTIDGTHIGIIAPSFQDRFAPGILFYNRKGYYSLNVQIVAGADLRILAINARYPGSVHDSGIWATSDVKQHLSTCYYNGERSNWLLGDSGYPLEPWLMTPILNPHGPAERRYNVAHKSVRNVIERVNGVLKSRFRCIHKHRTLNYSPERAGKIINTCAILHNFFITRNDNYDDGEDPGEDDHDDGSESDDGDCGNREPNLRLGRHVRNNLVLQYFNE